MTDFVIEKEKNETVLKQYIGNDEHVAVPDGVTKIGSNVFPNDNLKSVSVPDSVTFIDRMAFPRDGEEFADEKGFCIVGKFLLKYVGIDSTVVIPEGVAEISFRAFAGNNSLKKVVFPATIELIGNHENKNTVNNLSEELIKEIKLVIKKLKKKEQDEELFKHKLKEGYNYPKYPNNKEGKKYATILKKLFNFKKR